MSAAANFPSMDLRRSLGVIRVLVGAVTWLAPRTSGRAFGLGDVADDPRGALLGRLFGVRDVVLGSAVVFARDDAELSTALRLGLVVDTVDVAASVVGRRGGLSRWGTALVGGGAIVLAMMGTESLRRISSGTQGAA